jgi:hypothetical protein
MVDGDLAPTLSAAQNYSDSRDDKVELAAGNLAHALSKLLFIGCDEKGNVSYGVLGKTRHARAQNHVPGRVPPLQIASQRNTDCADSAGIDGIALNDQHWTPVARSRRNWLAQICPPDLTLCDHHSVRLMTRRAAPTRKASNSPSPTSPITRFICSVTRSAAWWPTNSVNARL